MDGGAWWAAVHGVSKTWTRLSTSLSLFTFMHWRRKWQPLQCSCLENPRDGGAWWAAVYGVTQSLTRLKRLSSSSNTRKNSPCYVPIPFFSYLISCCFSEHTVISAVLQTSQPSLPLFHCLCASVTKNNNPLRKKPTALKFYFSFHANIKRWLLHKLTLMLPTWVCALPAFLAAVQIVPWSPSINYIAHNRETRRRDGKKEMTEKWKKNQLKLLSWFRGGLERNFQTWDRVRGK